MRSCLLRLTLLCVLCLVVVTVSLPSAAQVLKGSVPAPAGSTILVPEDSFPGGVLTGVVIGPDDKPVANAQVNVTDAVPITLSGEVIGDQPQSPEKPPNPNRPQELVPAVKTAQDCAAVLQQFTGGVHPPNPNSGAPGASVPGASPSLITDAQGRFALCVPSNAKQIEVSLGDGSVHTSVPAVSQFPPDRCAQAGRFFQPAARVSVCQRLTSPTLTQAGQTWTLQRAVAISSGGDRVLTSLRTPRDLKPGPATLSFVNGDGKPQQFTGGVFKIVNARLDREQLHSHQGADFEYTAQFGDGSVRPCVHVTVAGPIVLVQAPPEIIAVDASGLGRFSGKIRATQVSPGSAVPFDINPTITNCEKNPGPTGLVGERNPGPTGTPGGKDPGPVGTPGEKQPGPAGSPSNGEMKLSLVPGPVAVNPFVQQEKRGTEPLPQQVAVNMPPPTINGPEHTMDAMDKYTHAPKPMSICNFQTQSPVITAVEGVKQPTVFTQQQGLNYFTVHGCNFGTTPGHVYLMLKPNTGAAFTFPTAVELYLMQGNNPWQANSIDVYVPESLSGYLDQNGVTLRVTTAKNLTAELNNQTFHAEREDLTMFWMPRSQVQLGDANPSLMPTFISSTPQSNTIIPTGPGTGRLDLMTAQVDRSVTNVGSPFTVQDDVWQFGAMTPGFEVLYATPYFQNWNGTGCDQTSGKWGTSWDSSTQFRVHVQGCYHNGTGAFRSSQAQYALQVRARGPKGVQPWPQGMK
jgi:hypothetical protein